MGGLFFGMIMISIVLPVPGCHLVVRGGLVSYSEPMPFLFLFIALPLIEIYFMIQIGSEIGAFVAIALTVFTAIFGLFLVRLQGLSVLFRVRDSMDQGEIPAIEMLEGASLMLAGVMLFLPGFLTDSLGFILLIPPLRRSILLFYLKKSGMRPAHRPSAADTEAERQGRPRIIEGEYRRDDK